MSTISASSSLDVRGIVDQLMQIEQRPLQTMERTLSGIQTQLSAYGRLQSALAGFQDAARALARYDTWDAATAVSSDEASVLATAHAGAHPGGHSIEVFQLANRQTLASTAFASADAPVGGGTLHIRMGSLDDAGTGFSPDSGRPEVSIEIAEGATLAEVRDAINAAGAGVRASLVVDGSGQRLMLRSTDSGSAQAFRIRVDDTDGSHTDATGLSALAFDPAAGAGSGRNLQLTQTAQDARLSVDGLAISAAGNRLEGVIENMTIDLRRPTTAPVEIMATSDRDSLRAALDGFVKAYNTLSSLISEQTRYDADTRTAGPLQGKQTPLRVQQQIRELMRSTIGDGPLDSLNAMGLELQRDGTLAVNETRLSAALAQPDTVRAFFAQPADESGPGGLAHRLVDRLGDLLASDGSLPNATEALRMRERSIQQQQERLNARLSEIEKRLLRQYTALDANLARIQGSFAGLDALLNANNDR